MEIEARTLRDGEQRSWVALGVVPNELPSRLDRFLKHQDAYPEEAICFTAAYDAGRLVGKLRGSVVHSKLYVIQSVVVVDGYDYAAIGRQLIDFVIMHNASRTVEAVAWDRPETAHFDGLLRGCGFNVYIEKVLVRRSLADFRNPYMDPFSYETLRQAGRDAFVTALAGVHARNPNRDAQVDDPAADFDETIDQAGSAFDEDMWLLARREGAIVGLVLPQVFPDSPDEGTVFNMGLAPSYRGRGWGKILHAKGLNQLSRAGITQYVDSTDILNEPMLRVFAANGCARLGIRRQYR